MVKTHSNLINLGVPAENFCLLDTKTGELVTLQQLKSEKATVIMFICNHCPFVQHVLDGIVQLANDYIPKGISFISINSNDISRYTEDAPIYMNKLSIEKQIPFPYLFDETQEIAKAYQAACTPDFFIYDGQLKLVYHGQLDDSRPGSGIPVSAKDIRESLDNIILNIPLSNKQKQSLGCNIKWKQT